ncbi:hypothetical protein [Paraburkholderia pallida]|nr:hypothetical protein [Paraburkholderia pallida]
MSTVWVISDRSARSASARRESEWVISTLSSRSTQHRFDGSF